MIYTEQIQAVLQKEGKSQPTLIQKETYEAIKNGASLVALAKTGTGKTLAYALPALERVIPGEKNSLVILAPTTELAVQIRNAILPFAKALGLKTLTLVGAGNRQRQDERLKKDNCEVLVCTPGRFFDFFSSGRIKLVQIKTLVIDEADDILEFAKLELLSSLGQNLPFSSQILLFGATESQITQEAEEIFARHFLLVDVRPDQGSQTEHVFLQVDNELELHLSARRGFAKDGADVEDAEAAHLHDVLQERRAAAFEHGGGDARELDHVVGHQPVSPGDQFKRQFALADAGIAGNQDAKTEDIHENAVRRNRVGKAPGQIQVQQVDDR